MRVFAAVSASKPRRRWFSFNLRTLFALVTVLGCTLAWPVRNYQRAVEQNRLLLSIPSDSHGSSLTWGYEWSRRPELYPHWVPDRIMDVLGNGFFGNVIAVRLTAQVFDPTAMSDQEFNYLLDVIETLPKLEAIRFDAGTVTDAQLERLKQRLPDLILLRPGFNEVSGIMDCPPPTR
jgi:hypothetical protein